MSLQSRCRVPADYLSLNAIAMASPNPLALNIRSNMPASGYGVPFERTMVARDDVDFLVDKPVLALVEMGAYERLWDQNDISFKSIAELFRRTPGAVPSDFVPNDVALEYASRVLQEFKEAGVEDFGIRVHGAGEYPRRLRDAVDPVELLYYRGWWDLVDAPKPVAIVGTREASDDGIRRTQKLVRLLVREGFTIVSGLASGIDTAAHTTAIEAGGHTIAVVGTPLSRVYPKVNAELQNRIGSEFLLISQVPAIRYGKQDYRKNRLFFPERNKTMSALTDATIIVEAGETSGTLIQAKAAFDQGRKLFILDSCFQKATLTWPRRFEERGAIRVRDFDDILNVMADGGEKTPSTD